jgi:hypothetical protein
LNQLAEQTCGLCVTLGWQTLKWSDPLSFVSYRFKAGSILGRNRRGPGIVTQGDNDLDAREVDDVADCEDKVKNNNVIDDEDEVNDCESNK